MPKESRVHQVLKVPRVYLVHRGKEVLEVLLVHMENQGHQDFLDPKGQRENLGCHQAKLLQETRATEGLQGFLAQMGFPGHQVLKVIRGHRDFKASKESRDLLEKLALQVTLAGRAQLDLKVTRGLKVSTVLLDFLVLLGHLGWKEKEVFQGLQGNLVQQEDRESWVIQEKGVHPGLTETRELLVDLASLASPD